MALQTSPEAPAPVRQIALSIQGWVERLGAVWVEGQVTQLSRRAGSATAFLTLRDALADISLSVTCPRALLDSLSPPLVEGASVVVHAKPVFYAPRGQLSLQAREIRAVGLGELLARLEQRRQLLAAEGLFDPHRKRRLPFLPRGVGLVTAKGSAAERDVVEHATRRWPAVRIITAYAAMQGPRCALEVMEALDALDRDPQVDVIVIARGGGAIEDLLPFSDEGLVRAVAAARTPVISAIGHEPDTPLLDLVADHRASTPTDAGKAVVPDVREEADRVRVMRDRARRCVTALVAGELGQLAALRSRPVLADPASAFDEQHQQVVLLRDRARRTLTHGLDRAGDDLAHGIARVRSLSPLATLERGYAVVQTAAGAALTDPAAVALGDPLDIRLAAGRLAATVAAPPEETA